MPFSLYHVRALRQSTGPWHCAYRGLQTAWQGVSKPEAAAPAAFLECLIQVEDCPRHNAIIRVPCTAIPRHCLLRVCIRMASYPSHHAGELCMGTQKQCVTHKQAAEPQRKYMLQGPMPMQWLVDRNNIAQALNSAQRCG